MTRTTLKNTNFNLSNYVSVLNAQHRKHKKLGNDFLAACYKQAAQRKLTMIHSLDQYFDNSNSREFLLDSRNLNERKECCPNDFRKDWDSYIKEYN